MEIQNSMASGEFLGSIIGYTDDMITQTPEYSREQAVLVIKDLYSHLGGLEGQRLKSLGLVSGEFENYFQQVSEIFGLNLKFSSSLKIPFAGSMAEVSLLTEHQQQVLIWIAYTSSMLSVYGMKPVSINMEGALTDEFAKVEFTEAAPESLGTGVDLKNDVQTKNFRHSLNNYLGGIISLISLLQKEYPDNDKLGLVMESARNIEGLAKGLGKQE